MIGEPEVLYAAKARRRCHDICDEIVTIIRGDTPIETGRLKGGYRVENDGRGAKIVNDNEYWHYVEFGTENMAAEPHVRPAIEIVRKRHTK